MNGLEAFNEKVKLYSPFEQENEIIEKELKEGEKAKQATTVIFRMFVNGIDINKVLFEVSISDSFEDFKMVYPYAVKEEYDLLKEVVL